MQRRYEERNNGNVTEPQAGRQTRQKGSACSAWDGDGIAGQGDKTHRGEEACSQRNTTGEGRTSCEKGFKEGGGEVRQGKTSNKGSQVHRERQQEDGERPESANTQRAGRKAGDKIVGLKRKEFSRQAIRGAPGVGEDGRQGRGGRARRVVKTACATVYPPLQIRR